MQPWRQGRPLCACTSWSCNACAMHIMQHVRAWLRPCEDSAPAGVACRALPYQTSLEAAGGLALCYNVSIQVQLCMQDLDKYAPEPEVHKYLHSRRGCHPKSLCITASECKLLGGTSCARSAAEACCADVQADALRVACAVRAALPDDHPGQGLLLFHPIMLTPQLHAGQLLFLRT
jgi:hypothetical protein